MVLKKNMKHPSFIIGVVSIIIMFIGIGSMANGYAEGNYIIVASIVLGGIHWIWSIVDVARDPNLRQGENRVFWLALVIVVPPLAGLVYYMMRRKRVSM
jgi:hypothetical protein